MQFSRNWLSEYVELPDTFEILAEGLTAAGLAVEGSKTVEDDILFDIDVTSNRPDCMSHLGVAREVSAVFGVPVRPPQAPAPGSVKIESNSWGSITIEDTDGCARYVGVVVRGVQVGPSPDWLKARLEAVGVRSINNIVDVTNFVLWEYGQPLHAFDADKLQGEHIAVRSARKGESLTTLDGERRELDSQILVIADAQHAVALAGIMGGLDTEVTAASKNVLIESAFFEPTRVRNGAKKLGIHTDASHRFERGADLECCLEAALRAAELIRELTGGEVDPDAIDVRVGMTEPLEGSFSLAGLCAFSGAEIDENFAVERLERLGFTLHPIDGQEAAWRVEVPSWRRHDFETDSAGAVYPAYFYEEVLRMFGLDAIPSTLPAIEGPDRGSGRSHRRREDLRRFLAATGLAETVTYSFGSAAAEARFENLVEGPSLKVENALSEQYAFLRRSLLPNLVEGALFNLRREAQAVRLFEFGHLFPAAGAEVDALGIVLGGTLGSPWRREVTQDLFDLKGIFEELGREQGAALEFEPRSITGFVSGTSAEVILVSDAQDRRRIGYLGRVDEEDSPVALYAGEIEIEVLDRKASDTVFVPSRYPGVTVDLTLTHSVQTSWKSIADAIRKLGSDGLASFEMIDRYQGAGVPEGAVNTTVAFRYNAEDRSLTQEEVNQHHDRMRQELERRFRSDAARS